MRTWTPREVGAAGVFLVAAAWMQVGPVVHQVFRYRLPPMTMAWQMYHGKGADVCAVSWQVARGDGFEPLDRLALLAPEGVWELEARRRRQHSKREIRSEALALCALTDDDVRADAWCGTRPDGAWKQVWKPEESLCKPR
jgi:hypothetical protein